MLCDVVGEVANNSITDHDFFCIGMWAAWKDRKDIKWPKWHMYYCDKCHVPFQCDNDDSTYAVYERELFDHVPLDPAHLYLIDL